MVETTDNTLNQRRDAREAEQVTKGDTIQIDQILAQSQTAAVEVTKLMVLLQLRAFTNWSRGMQTIAGALGSQLDALKTITDQRK